jgi:MFS family permease
MAITHDLIQNRAAGALRGERSASRWLPLSVIAAAHLMAILDITVMFVALPSAQHALGMSVGARQWVLTAYTLAFASLLLLGGRLADRIGARRTLIEGIGTGLAGPAILSTLLRAVAREDTGAASAASSAAGQLGSSIGAALLNTIAATATAAYVVTHASAGAAAATVHGYAVAAAWGAGLLLVLAIPIVMLINAGVPRRASQAGRR